MFALAARKKLRFGTTKGQLTVEDLYDLPLLSANQPCLNTLAKKYNKLLKEEDEENFVGATTTKANDNELKFNIVKHIIDQRIAENEAKKKLAKNKEKRDLILSIINDKENEEMKSKSKEDLLKMLEDED